MNKNRNSFMQQLSRVGMVAFLFVGALTVMAQEEAGGEAKAKSATQKAAVNQELKEISGYVYDAASKKPLGGVHVEALGYSSFTAMTKDDGRFAIRVPEYVTSLYVFVQDYSPSQIAIKGNTNQNVYLYRGLLKNVYENSTSLVNSSSASFIEPTSITIENEIENVLNAEVRTINRGGMPAMGAMLLMNGINSLNSNAQPLVVVDGVIWDMQYDRASVHQGFFNNVFSTIDPEDIESVKTLKNGTALYGAKGANGVLLINTKRGRNQTTRINVRIYGGFETTPSKVKMMNAGHYRNYVTEFLGTTEYAEKLGQGTNVPFLNENPSYIYYQQYHNQTDWQSDLYENAFTQNYKVSVEGGDEIAMYNLSLGYTQSEATARRNNFNRLNIRFNTDINMFKDFVTGFDVGYSRAAYNLRDNGWSYDWASENPTTNVSSPNVLGLLQAPFLSPYLYFVYYDHNTMNLRSALSTSVYAGKEYDEANNPLAFAKNYGYAGLPNPYWILLNGQGDNKNNQEQMQFSMNVNPRYKINKYWTVSDRFSYVLNRTNEIYYMPRYGTPTIYVEGLGNVKNIIRSLFAKETSLYNDLRGEWKRSYGAHNFDVFGGFRFASFTYTNNYIVGYNNGNDKMPNIKNDLDYKDAGGLQDKWNSLTWYASGDYNYRNTYFVNVAASMESSSRFGDKASGGLELAGVRWAFFPSVQAGWLMSSEKWFNVKAVDFLKITAGFDMSGNDAANYSASRTYFENIKFLHQNTALILGNIENPSIKWETTRRFNIGFETSLFRNRLALGVQLYTAKTSDLLTRKTVNDLTGLQLMWTNDGSLKNRGFNVNVDGVILATKNLQWQAGFTIGHYHNEVSKLANTTNSTITTYALDATGHADPATARVIKGYASSIYGDNNVLTAVGHPVGVFYGYKTAGVFATDAEAAAAGNGTYLLYPTGIAEQPSRPFRAGDVHFIDQNGDGWISEADKVIIGDPNPDIYGNIYSTLTWKRFRLDLNFKYSVGNDIFNFQRSQLEAANNVWNQTTAVVNRWRYDGQRTDVPRTMCSTNDEWVNNERFSDRWIEDGSFLKMKKVRLTYKVKTPLNWSWLLGLDVWAEANNVFTITKYLGSDPEVSVSNNVLYQGIDAGMLPANRTFNFGVTINL